MLSSGENRGSEKVNVFVLNLPFEGHTVLFFDANKRYQGESFLRVANLQLYVHLLDLLKYSVLGKGKCPKVNVN